MTREDSPTSALMYLSHWTCLIQCKDIVLSIRKSNYKVPWVSYLYNENPYTWRDCLCIEQGPGFVYIYHGKHTPKPKAVWPIHLILTHWGQDKMDETLQATFSNEFPWMTIFFILIKISLKFVCKGPVNNISALVQIMTWHRSGNKPLSESMMAMVY